MLRALRRQHLQNLQASVTPASTPTQVTPSPTLTPTLTPTPTLTLIPTKEGAEAKKKKKKKAPRSASVPPKSGGKSSAVRDPEALRGEALQKEAVALARAVMRTADTNKNKASHWERSSRA